ncbi:hypothetical protein PHYSODRAFT_497071 [Phytophthora sojae]|uniref:Matrin-type domain-containing protein n=1 Tax=Phytophthora sojae (strain P6497) TaxID=1094619 RepID=G4ZBQ7_PHYSP|nr:hypothetical protein PHYSODRAFT_497071 [Phytophthora sojae]EGZ21261.1 hypothetical protein PHYSODRAFT_497071 [Phytophthora sojae]|eukprot:XP_009523978.1 hypothetical protein PHYSODRAFT_497071 [Phytophthora sojae]
MVDYWVSRERHYCKYCNVWMQSDKLSIKHHEQGRRHKEKVEETFKAKRQTKSDASSAQKELRDQLQQIEEAAQAKYEQDMAGRAPPPPPRRPGQPNAPPPPPRRPGQSGGQYRPPAMQEKEPQEEEEEDDKGVYAVRGVVYLEGKKHETQLETGSACQIWVEEAEQWIDALVERATVHTVPNTELSFRRFTVMYMLPPSEDAEKNEDKPKPVTEHEVLADRLRIPLPANVTLEAAEKMVDQWRNGGDAAGVETHAPVVIDETTGMGEWSTVEVRQIDESPEAVAKRAAEAEAEASRLAEEQKRMDALEDFSSQGDNALGAFNPWGGSYKEEINITTNRNVSFKKRGQKKQKRRRIHTDDE